MSRCTLRAVPDMSVRIGLLVVSGLHIPANTQEAVFDYAALSMPLDDLARLVAGTVEVTARNHDAYIGMLGLLAAPLSEAIVADPNIAKKLELLLKAMCFMN
jgi:hypothetical protein